MVDEKSSRKWQGTLRSSLGKCAKEEAAFWQELREEAGRQQALPTLAITSPHRTDVSAVSSHHFLTLNLFSANVAVLWGWADDLGLALLLPPATHSSMSSTLPA